MLIPSSKSSPLIEQTPKNQRSSKSSKRSSRQRDSNEYEYRKVANPFLIKQQENYLPDGLLNEVGNMEYLTPHLVQKIPWGQAVAVPRRSSVFSKHLQAMQRAVKQQQQKTRKFLGIKNQNSVCFQEMQDQKSVSNEQNQQCGQDGMDGVSLGMHHWLQIQPQRMENQQMMMMFDDQGEQAESVHFYSANNIEYGMQDLDDYFFP